METVKSSEELCSLGVTVLTVQTFTEVDRLWVGLILCIFNCFFYLEFLNEVLVNHLANDKETKNSFENKMIFEVARLE